MGVLFVMRTLEDERSGVISCFGDFEKFVRISIYCVSALSLHIESTDSMIWTLPLTLVNSRKDTSTANQKSLANWVKYNVVNCHIFLQLRSKPDPFLSPSTKLSTSWTFGHRLLWIWSPPSIVFHTQESILWSWWYFQWPDMGFCHFHCLLSHPAV